VFLVQTLQGFACLAQVSSSIWKAEAMVCSIVTNERMTAAGYTPCAPGLSARAQGTPPAAA